MNILTLDFETFFSDDFTLKKMTTEAYIRDPRFEALLCGFRYQDGRREWVGQEDLPTYMATIDWNDTAVLMHHAHFDGLILSHNYGIKPRFIYDTLPMARLLLGNHISVGLESLARHYGLDPKSVPYDKFRGRRWAEIEPSLRQELGAGCLHDIDLTWDIFQRLAHTFPAQEYAIIDMNTRAFTEPKMIGDVQTLGEVWTYEAVRKDTLLKQLAEDTVPAADLPTQLQSNEKFASLLRARDVDPAKKQGTNGAIYAFAKTDPFMVDLLEHDDENVRTLAEARLGLKSTLDQTRSERLGFMANRGAMCVYLANYAAHTTRYGGGDKVNWQNFKRGSLIRKAMKAPTGHKLVKADKSQIECRILNYVAGQWDVIERFAKGLDPYTGIASRFYEREITKNDPAERGVGKQLELSCGYGSGADTIVRTAKRGTYGPPVQLTQDQGLAARDLYRSTHAGVVDYWKTAGRMIAALAGTEKPVSWGPLLVDTGVIYLGQTPIWYPELHYYADPESGERYWRYKTRRGYAKLYGGKLTENVVQFMSAVDMRESLIRIKQRTGIGYAAQEHDAAVWVVPDSLVTPFVSVVESEMSRSPEWLPGIPLACEVTVGETM